MRVTRVDNSRLVAVSQCDTRAIMEFVHGYQARKEPAPMYGGKHGHEALATYFGSGSVEQALGRFAELHKPFSDANNLDVSEDYRNWGFKNMYDVLSQYLSDHPLERFPFTVVEDSIETPVTVRLTDDVELWCMLDLLGRERSTGALYPVDHKFRGSRITHWWLSKFKRGSQLTAYMYAAAQQFDEIVPGAYLNVIDMQQLPELRYTKAGNPYKCRTHSCPVTECRHLHSNHQLRIVSRTPQMLQEWYAEAVDAAKHFRALSVGFSDINLVPHARVQGIHNGACDFCQFADWCNSGRKVDLIDQMLIHAPWEPWERG